MIVLPADGVPRVACAPPPGSQHTGQGAIFEHHGFPEDIGERKQVMCKGNMHSLTQNNYSSSNYYRRRAWDLQVWDRCFAILAPQTQFPLPKGLAKNVL